MAGSNQRTITRQKAQLNAYLKVGKEITLDSDIHFLVKPNRLREDINRAFSSIELNQDKVLFALFWFFNNNHLDETALSYLQSGDYIKAEDIWHKIIEGKDVSTRNLSAFNNLGTLKMANAFSNGIINLEDLKKGITLKTKLIISDSFTEFCRLVADETYSVDQDKELQSFIEILFEEISDKIKNTKDLIYLFDEIHPKVKFIVASKFTITPLHNLERQIDISKKSRIENPEDAFDFARVLFKETKNDLKLLLELLGENDLKYQLIADKLAKELLQCGIDYFQEYRDDEELHSGNLGEDVMKLFKASKTIAQGHQAKERINENITGLQEWIEGSEERKKQRLIEEDVKFIYSKLERFQDLEDSIQNSKALIESCKPKLFNIKSVIGNSDDFYLKLSSVIVHNAQEMLVTVVNNQQEYAYITDFSNVKSTIDSALSVSNIIGHLDMVPELRSRYNQNHNTLKSISSKLNGVVSSYASRSHTTYTSSKQSNGGGCYIATMAYGSYEHPQVLVLRKFRDDILLQSPIGKLMVRGYYFVSPKMVRILDGNQFINSLIRKLLDKLIIILK